MKTTRSVILLRFPALFVILWCVFFSWFSSADEASKARALFRKPPREYSTGPLWVWNDLLTEEQIRSTLRDLAAQDVKQVWVHPRPGLMTPYLSAEWFRLWKISLEEAGRLDMNVWIYDENSYPSGFAGGFVPELMPESRGRGLVMREVKTAPKWSEGMIGVYRLADATSENVSAKVKAGESLPEATYLVVSEVRAGNSPWHGNRCYVNLLSPGVTEKFIEVTLEAYRREIGSQFGKRVPGVFTDEPNIRPAGEFPWSEILSEEFQKRWGYDLIENLPSLAKPVGDWRKVRHNYLQLLHEQFVKHWAIPNHEYCRTNHLEWTGHYWDHEWPNCMGVPDNMAMYAWHQRPAIDCLMNQYAENTHAQFGNVRMCRELLSVANQLGAKRTLVEIYGAGGWDLRFEDMKRIGDWLEVLGVNTLNQHLSYVTIRGARKRDHPQSFSYHVPWWPAYHISAEYLARFSAALSQGEQINRVAVLEPTTTAWMYQKVPDRLQQIGDSFFKLLMALEAGQVEYDLVCEDVLVRHGSVTTQGKGGELRVGKRAYPLLVVPEHTENLNSTTVKLLDQFVNTASAPKVVCLGEIPNRVDGSFSEAVAGISKRPGWKTVRASEVAETLKPGRMEGFAIVRDAGDKGILFHHRRQLEGGQILALVNTSIDSPSAGIIESSLRGVEKWDLYTGEFEPFAFEKSGDGIKTRFELPPSGSLILFLSAKPMRGFAPRQEVINTLKPVSGPRIARVGPNVLTLDYLDVTARGETRTNIYFYQGNQFVWQKNGMQRNPWDSAVQFQDELIAKTFPADSGFEASYRFTISEQVPSGLSIVIERPDLYTLACNGQRVTAKPGDWWLDKAFGRLDIASCARVGENVVTLKARPFTMFHELEPAYLLGDFSLKSAASGFVVVPPQGLSLGSSGQALAHGNNPDDSGSGKARGGWNRQGLPFYSDGVVYRETFDLARKSGRYLVNLTDWYGSVAVIKANGKPAGYVDAPPWQCDVTKHLRPGRNEIEVTVIGTPKNLLGPHHGNPSLGSAWPGSFQTAPNPGPPAGERYSTVAYGLFAPFDLQQRLK